MISSSPLRQQTALRVIRSVPIKCLQAPKAQCRRIHNVPRLTHDDHFREHGVPGMLSPEGFDTAWTQYQGYVVDKLNRLTAGTPDEHSITKNILLKYARQADRASLFNHASMAHNNHLFFNTISPDPPPLSSLLESHITASFSSHSSLRTTFLATATAMFGPGFVWLVKKKSPLATREDTLAILTTYNAGSPYPGAHYRQQPFDVATANSSVTGSMTPQQYAAAQDTTMTAGAFAAHSQNAKKLAPGGAELEVLLGVSTWEHVWLRDWGVGGKRQFLEQWWERIDWGVVEALGAFKGGSKRPFLYDSSARPGRLR